jgi:hypothetical protein
VCEFKLFCFGYQLLPISLLTICIRRNNGIWRLSCYAQPRQETLRGCMSFWTPESTRMPKTKCAAMYLMFSEFVQERIQIFNNFAGSALHGLTNRIWFQSSGGLPQCLNRLKDIIIPDNSKLKWLFYIRARVSIYNCVLQLHLCWNPQSKWTALIWASSRGYTDCARLLLDYGADKDLKDEVCLIEHCIFCFLLLPQ